MKAEFDFDTNSFFIGCIVAFIIMVVLVKIFTIPTVNIVESGHGYFHKVNGFQFYPPCEHLHKKIKD